MKWAEWKRVKRDWFHGREIGVRTEVLLNEEITELVNSFSEWVDAEGSDWQYFG